MQADHFATVRELFDRVVDLSEGERETALRSATSDPALIEEVLALCDALRRANTTRFANPINSMVESAAAQALAPGDRLGPWRIVREIGAGGMGSVYLVERTDGHYKQTAALKLVKGMANADTLAYFTRERQLLATLTHPNIARLLDGGAAPGGHPYLVMEYVDGLPIDLHCREKQLGTNAILDLFVTACDAVAFAHRRLIIHCDLKPSNLLIEREGRPVLLDFGIARLADKVAMSEHANDYPAEPASPAYTPRYASPELRAKGAVSTVSDIYSLGVMLRELLDIARTRNPELAAIVAKATADDPARRYPGVDALTDDIRRFRSSLPVEALPAGTAYVVRKFVARRWALVSAAAVFLLTVAVFTTMFALESQRAQRAELVAVRERDAAALERDGAARERDRAQAAEQIAARQRDLARSAEESAARQRDIARAAETKAVTERNRATAAEAGARQTTNFLLSVFDSGSPTGESGDMPASKLLANAGEQVETALKGQPSVQSEIYDVLGVVQLSMGSVAESIKLHERAIEIERKQNRPLVLAEALFNLAETRIVNGEMSAALALAREALALREKHGKSDSAELGRSYSQVGMLLAYTGATAEAGPFILRGVAIHEKAEPKSNWTAYTLANLASYQSRTGDFQSAQATFQRGLAIRVALYGEGHPKVIKMREDLAVYLNRAGRREEGEAVLREALAARIKLLGRENRRVALAYERLGTLVAGQDRHLEGMAAYHEALDIFLKTGARGTESHTRLLVSIAEAQSRVGDFAGVVASTAEAEPLLRNLGSSARTSLVTNLRLKGFALTRLGRLDEARQYLIEARELSRKGGEKAAENAYALIYLTDWALASGKLAQADAYLAELKAFQPIRNGGWNAYYLRVVAQTAGAHGRIDEALRTHEAAEQSRARFAGENALMTWREKIYRAELLARRAGAGDGAAAAALAREIHANIAAKLDPASPVLADLRRLMALA